MTLLFQTPETEYVNEYRPGGFHPVHLGDRFHDGRYEVVRKLGAGAFATVWLVQDHVDGGFSALKIMRADAPRRELDILRRLKLKCDDIDDYVVQLRDSFEHEGPNGVHLCIVTEVLGPSLAAIEDDLEDSFPDEILPPGVVHAISVQIARGLARIHEAGIIHGDLTKRNILLTAPAFGRWRTIADVDQYMTEPQTAPLQLDTGEPASPSPHRPSYTVYGLLSIRMTTACFEDPANVRGKICDFGEASLVESPSDKVHIPAMYASPEAIVLRSTGPHSDVWALAVIVHDLVAIGSPLFGTPWQKSQDLVLAGIVLRLGKLPDNLWTKWEARSTYFDEDGQWIGTVARPLGDDEVGQVVSTRVQSVRCGGDVSAFAKVIRALCDYDISRRISAADAATQLSLLWNAARQ